MEFQSKRYNRQTDYERVYQFLLENHEMKKERSCFNWNAARWEYMHYHPFMIEAEDKLSRCGIWEERGNIVAVVNLEDGHGEAYFQLKNDPRYEFLKEEMLEYAENNLVLDGWKGQNELRIYIHDWDHDLEKIALKRGFQKADGGERETVMWLTGTPLEYTVPDGFRIASLTEGNDIEKLHRVLHRGFDHEGEPPEDGIEGRRLMQSAPNYDLDQTIVAIAPNGDYASFVGSWYLEPSRSLYLEPVATDPTYRRMGLATACIYEAANRAMRKGATSMTGGGGEFYDAIGFEGYDQKNKWVKEFN